MKADQLSAARRVIMRSIRGSMREAGARELLVIMEKNQNIYLEVLNI